MTRNSKSFIKILLLFLPLMVPMRSFCWNVSPMSNQITHKDKSYFFLTVTADESRSSIPIEVYGVKRMLDEKGNETHERVDDLFFIYPSQFLLEPRGMQRVRVYWKGNIKKLKTEEAYRIIIEGTPLEAEVEKLTDKVAVGIKLLKTFVTSLYVTPKNVKYKLKIVSHEVKQMDGKNSLVLHLHNSGDAHLTFFKPLIKLTHKRKSYTFDIDKIKDIVGTVVVLPGHHRECIIPLPTDFPTDFPIEAAKVSMDLKRIKS
ncbi:MAG: hypothetical protein AAF443_00850 [Chlamydiota bacterium]